MSEGKLIGPNLMARLTGGLAWTEQQMGMAEAPQYLRPQILQPPGCRIQFEALEDIPAYGVVALSRDSTTGDYMAGNEDEWHIKAGAPLASVTGGGGAAIFKPTCLHFINDKHDVDAGDKGYCYSAMERPRWALINHATITPVTSLGTPPNSVGPVPGSFELHAGLPGFMIMGPYLKPPDVSTGDHMPRALVIRDPGGGGWAKAAANWSTSGSSIPYVDANPVTDGSDAPEGVYDGVDYEPEIVIRIYLPRGETERDPNVQTGNRIAYRSFGLWHQLDVGEVVAAGDYLDDKIGTVKMYALGGGLPQGWRKYAAASDNDFIQHHSTPGGSSTFGASGSVYTSRHLTLIERFE